MPSILWHDETVENIVQGTYNNGNGILVATNKRLVFIDKGIFFGLKVDDFPYDKVSSIQYETGFVFGKLTIFTSGNKAVIENVLKKKVRHFGDSVRAKIFNYTSSTIVQSPQQHTSLPAFGNTDSIDVVEQLERLAKLKTSGILTEDEFLLQKKKILNM